MALKFKIGGTVYDALSADVKKEYKKEGDDYVLDLEGYEDPAELRRARDHEKEAAATAKRERDTEKARADKAEKKVGDLEKSGAKVEDAVNAKDKEWQTKYDTDIAAEKGKVTNMQDTIKSSRRMSLAETLANEVSTSPLLLKDHIAKRIDVEIGEDGSVKEYILNKEGKRTAGTVDDLKKEVLQTKDYAPILRSTKGSGGGGAPPAPGGGGAPRSGLPTRPGFAPQPGTAPVDLTKLSPQDFAAQITAQKEAAGQGGA